MRGLRRLSHCMCFEPIMYIPASLHACLSFGRQCPLQRTLPELGFILIKECTFAYPKDHFMQCAAIARKPANGPLHSPPLGDHGEPTHP